MYSKVQKHLCPHKSDFSPFTSIKIFEGQKLQAPLSCVLEEKNFRRKIQQLLCTHKKIQN